MRHVALLVTVASLALAAAAPAGARPPGPDPQPWNSPEQVAAPSPSPVPDGGLDTGWILLIAGGSAVLAAGAGFAGGRRTIAARS